MTNLNAMAENQKREVDKLLKQAAAETKRTFSEALSPVLAPLVGRLAALNDSDWLRLSMKLQSVTPIGNRPTAESCAEAARRLFAEADTQQADRDAEDLAKRYGCSVPQAKKWLQEQRDKIAQKPDKKITNTDAVLVNACRTADDVGSRIFSESAPVDEQQARDLARSRGVPVETARAFLRDYKAKK